MSHQTFLNRRRFIQSVGASALTLPFLKSLPSYADGSEKKYLILLFTPNGVVRNFWGATQTGAGQADFELKELLLPLKPFQNQVTVVHGLQNRAAGFGTHGPGIKSLWTGASVDGDDGKGSLPSIDQTIGKGLGLSLPYHSIAFRARSPQDYEGISNENRMIFGEGGAQIDPYEDPVDTAEELFLGVAAGGSAPAPSDSKLDRRKALAAFTQTELGVLEKKLCTEDRSHLQALREGWSELEKTFNTGSSAAAACERPSPTGVKDMPTTLKEQIENLVMALACDLTRVASLQISQAGSPMIPDFLGISSDFHNGISHQVTSTISLGPNAPIKYDPENPTTAQIDTEPVRQSNKVNTWFCEQIAYLAQRLSEIPVEGSKTLLDQCVICWGNELDNGNNHDHYVHPFALIGGGAGRIKAGQYLQLPLSPNGQPDLLAGGRNHNDLLATLGSYMGVDLGTIGDPALNQGVITELLV